MTEDQFEKIMAILTETRDLLKTMYPSSVAGAADCQAIEEVHTAVWADYLKQKQPKNDYERIALIVDHLVRQQKEGGVTVGEIVEFIHSNPDDFSNVGQKELSKAINNTKNNKSYGYIEFADTKEKDRYRLSVKGAQLVRALPNRLERKR